MAADRVGHRGQLARVQVGAEAERQHGQRGQLGGERLGRRARPAPRRPAVTNARSAGLGQRRPAVVGDRHGRARRSRAPRPASRRSPRSRPDWDSATASTPDRSSRRRYVGGDRRRGQRGQPAGVRLEQVAAVDRGVVGGAAGDEQHLPGRRASAATSPLRGSSASSVARSAAGCCADLGPHRGAARVTAAPGAGCTALSAVRPPRASTVTRYDPLDQIQVAAARRSSSSQTRSAAAPGAIRPRSGRPIRSAGSRVAASTAERRSTPAATTLATAASIRSAEPAIVPSARRGGTPAPAAARSARRRAGTPPAACPRTRPRR